MHIPYAYKSHNNLLAVINIITMCDEEVKGIMTKRYEFSYNTNIAGSV